MSQQSDNQDFKRKNSKETIKTMDEKTDVQLNSPQNILDFSSNNFIHDQYGQNNSLLEKENIAKKDGISSEFSG